MIEATIFLGAAIIGATKLVKLLAPNVNGAITILVALGLGVLVALIDTEIGVADFTVAEGIMIALGASGAVTVAEKV